MRIAVSLVTCKHPDTLCPARGLSNSAFYLNAAKAGILLLAQATLFSPASAKEISATVYEPDVSMM